MSKLFGNIRTILLENWDPIGIVKEPCAQDEYDSYIPPIIELLKEDDPIDAITTYLMKVETEDMYPGMNHNTKMIENQAFEVAEKISKLECE